MLTIGLLGTSRRDFVRSKEQVCDFCCQRKNCSKIESTNASRIQYLHERLKGLEALFGVRLLSDDDSIADQFRAANIVLENSKPKWKQRQKSIK